MTYIAPPLSLSSEYPRFTPASFLHFLFSCQNPWHHRKLRSVLRPAAQHVSQLPTQLSPYDATAVPRLRFAAVP